MVLAQLAKLDSSVVGVDQFINSAFTVPSGGGDLRFGGVKDFLVGPVLDLRRRNYRFDS